MATHSFKIKVPMGFMAQPLPKPPGRSSVPACPAPRAGKPVGVGVPMKKTSDPPRLKKAFTEDKESKETKQYQVDGHPRDDDSKSVQEDEKTHKNKRVRPTKEKANTCKESEKQDGMDLYKKLSSVKRRKLSPEYRDKAWSAGKCVEYTPTLTSSESCAYLVAQRKRLQEEFVSDATKVIISAMGFDIGVIMTFCIILIVLDLASTTAALPRFCLVHCQNLKAGHGTSSPWEACRALHESMHAFFVDMPAVDLIVVELQPPNYNKRTYALQHALFAWLDSRYTHPSCRLKKPLIDDTGAQEKITWCYELGIVAKNKSYSNSNPLNKALATQACLQLLCQESEADTSGTAHEALLWWINQPKQDDFADSIFLAMAYVIKNHNNGSFRSPVSSADADALSLSSSAFPLPAKKKKKKGLSAAARAIKTLNRAKIAEKKGDLDPLFLSNLNTEPTVT